MVRDTKIPNALKRSEIHRKNKREKEQIKLKRRMEIKKAEKEKGVGAQLKKERLAKNVPRTIDNTRIFDDSSYLTANPATLAKAAEAAAKASKLVNGQLSGSEEEDDEEEDGSSEEGAEDEEDEDEPMPEAGPSKPSTYLSTQPPAEGESTTDGEATAPTQLEPARTAPPRILLTTSPAATKVTYTFCEDLRAVFPGGEFFKRPKGRGFELGRLARWGAKRGFEAMVVVNEDHKKPNAITVIKLPGGPTAYFKLSSVTLGSQIAGHARASPHSPELILNNFTTLLGNSVGRLFGSLFPPMPQFRGRQVVTLHNQRDFLFFRRHRYMFASATQAKLQEIGPRFTLKLRWLRKGLPAVSAGDGSIPRGGDSEADGEVDEDELARQEKMDEDEAMEEMGEGKAAAPQAATGDLGVAPLDEEQEYEWKWKPKMEVSRRTFFL